ncbi:MAG: glycerophosphodiester phosphodiesterase, partial [Clostridia bacterium]|nr:glycerophosphodiester phosphodiesterase [Clostridia bacterium]
MEAFQAALDLGVDQIETDVRVTKDGKLVLIHDATVDRTTNGTGNVEDYTLEELQKLDAGNGTKIPTLIDLMELVKDYPT